MIDMVYTPCDAYHAHWNLSADSAEVRGGYFIKACNIVFKIGGIPVFFTSHAMVFPIQGRSKSGFLIPRFYFDYVYGFGL
jgi:lipopolysaccharide assembly outer membrane protein LptD (OstA)